MDDMKMFFNIKGVPNKRGLCLRVQTSIYLKLFRKNFACSKIILQKITMMIPTPSEAWDMTKCQLQEVELYQLLASFVGQFWCFKKKKRKPQSCYLKSL